MAASGLKLEGGQWSKLMIHLGTIGSCTVQAAVVAEALGCPFLLAVKLQALTRGSVSSDPFILVQVLDLPAYLPPPP